MKIEVFLRTKTNNILIILIITVTKLEMTLSSESEDVRYASPEPSTLFPPKVK